MIAVNEIFSDEITKIDSSMQLNLSTNTPSYRSLAQKTLQELVDQLGEQSAHAQGLSKVITTYVKMRNSTNTIYLLKDADANGGQGELIGFLKIGHKKLFLFDEENRTHEVEPLCVLDFFVSPAYQRRGYGKKLFNFMLQDTGSRVQELAVDGPSSKLEQFLLKNYGLDHLVRQNNNFAITPHFFPPGTPTNSSGRNTPVDAPCNFGRYAAHKPTSSIGKIIHGEQKMNNSVHEPVELARSAAATPAPAQPLPSEGSKPPSEGSKPPSEGSKPPSEGSKPPSEGSKPPSEGSKPPTEGSKPPTEFSKPPSARPSTLGVEPAVRPPLPPAVELTSFASGGFRPIDPETPAGVASSRDGAQLTKKGYFDVKNYHNKLW